MVIRFFASIRNITGVKEIEWGEPVPTVGDLLRLLSERYGPEFRRWVFDGESLGSAVMVVINGNDARHHGGLATRLTPSDIVSLLPMMAGGSPPGNQLSALSGQLSEKTRKNTKDEGVRSTEPTVNGRVHAVVSS
jgi:MoaD family protein